jgi:hypothetical protein
MNVDAMLSRAAASIGRMPAHELAAGLEHLEAEHRRRMNDDLARARYEALIDSLDLEPAAHELAQQYEQQGNLQAAAHWYRVAARGDHADAALRLGVTLDLLADRACRQADPNSYSNRRDELFLIREAAQAYSEAYAAGYTEAADKMDDMFAAFVRRQARTVDPTRGETPAKPEEECTYVRDSSSPDDVLRDTDIIRLSQHAAHCVPCLKVLIAQAVEAASAVPTGIVSLTAEIDEKEKDKVADNGGQDPAPTRRPGARTNHAPQQRGRHAISRA